MISKVNPYNAEIPEISAMQQLSANELSSELKKYLSSYEGSFVRSQQIKYFETYVQGLLSNLDRKSIEPIALTFLGEKEVRRMQQFFTRSRGWDASLSQIYKAQLSGHITDINGFLSVDESDFVKKGKESAGVARQYCGRLGKKENCQAGVFLSYASEKGIGLLASQLYLPKIWFSDEYENRRKDCQIPSDVTFKSKNAMAKEMIKDVLESQLFEVEYIGCDASFGSDHTFLDSLPESVRYFASVRKNEYIFREMPEVFTPENVSGRGRRFKHPRAEELPVSIETIADDDTVPWVRRVIAEGTKGPIIAEIKCLPAVSCRKVNRLFVPKSDIWVYIRKYEDGNIKYFVSNAPADTPIYELDRLATARWSIEQCFQECKSYLGMAHYETRSYQAWHRHMLLVMIAQMFITVLRIFFLKIRIYHNADGSVYYGFTYNNYFNAGGRFENCDVSVAP